MKKNLEALKIVLFSLYLPHIFSGSLIGLLTIKGYRLIWIYILGVFMKKCFFQIVILTGSIFLSNHTSLQGYSFWGKTAAFNFNGQSVTPDSNQESYNTFVKALRSNGYTVSSFVTGQLLKKRAKAEAALLEKFGMTQTDWQNVKSILSSYASQQRGGVITGSESVAALIKTSVQPLPSLNIVFKDEEPSVFQVMSITAGIFRRMIAYVTSSKEFIPPSFNFAETPNLYLPINFESRPLSVKTGTILHEVAGHINHYHVIEGAAVREIICKKCSLSESAVERAAEWLKFKRLQEWEADWYPAVKNSKSASHIESMLQDFYRKGRCDGRGTEHPDNLKRYQYATIIRRLLETEEQH